MYWPKGRVRYSPSRFVRREQAIFSTSSSTLSRSAFEVSRASEYFSVSELTAKTGQSKDNFSTVILKELVDNAIDAAECTGQTPSVRVRIEDVGYKTLVIEVKDNGAGMAPETVRKILNFNTRTSTKQAYVSPTRGAQGNALKTILGIPYALTGKPTELAIISQGMQHEIKIGFDPAGEPRIDHATLDADMDKTIELDTMDQTIERDKEEAAKKGCPDQGTIIRVRTPQTDNFMPRFLLRSYALFNPHIELVADESTIKCTFSPSADQSWKKVVSSDLTSVHWYTEERFRRLLYCYIAEFRNGGENKTLKNFIAEFRGLKGRSAIQQVANQFQYKYLANFDGKDTDIARLFEAMKKASAPPSPNILGSIGEDHYRKRFQEFFDIEEESFTYKCKSGVSDGLPFVVEMAFALTKIRDGNWLFHGINHAPAYSDPFQRCEFRFNDKTECVAGIGFDGMVHRMNNPYGYFSYEPGNIAASIHVICPRFDYRDQGKAPIIIPEIGRAASEVITYCLKEQYFLMKKVKNEAQREDARTRREEAERQKRIESNRIHLSDAIFREIPNAVSLASGGGKIPASYRSVYYQIRRLIQQYEIKVRRNSTGELTLEYFRGLFKAYQRKHGYFPLIYAEPRGYLLEPHTGKKTEMGTREVEEYHLPEHLFNKILYVEKLGLLPTFEAVKLAERYDCAIIAGQGFAVDAVKSLLTRVDKETDIIICCLHDADPAGYDIGRTLSEATKNTPGYRVDVIDFGLTIAEAEKWDLEKEWTEQSRRISSELLKRLTDEEKKYFLPEDYHPTRKPPWKIYRFELNAFRSDQLIEYVESKFKEYGIQGKVLPEESLLESEAQREAESELESRIREEIISRIGIEKKLTRFTGNRLRS